MPATSAQAAPVPGDPITMTIEVAKVAISG
jgi:hypothetical protein